MQLNKTQAQFPCHATSWLKWNGLTLTFKPQPCFGASEWLYLVHLKCWSLSLLLTPGFHFNQLVASKTWEAWGVVAYIHQQITKLSTHRTAMFTVLSLTQWWYRNTTVTRHHSLACYHCARNSQLWTWNTLAETLTCHVQPAQCCVN